MYGYEIVQTLIVDIIPDPTVKKAMNEINAGVYESIYIWICVMKSGFLITSNHITISHCIHLASCHFKAFWSLVLHIWND